MGLDPERFLVEPCHELICCICEGVFEEPLQCPREHIFCSKCIRFWLRKSRLCPCDMEQLGLESLEQVPRVVQEMISNSRLCCRFSSFGCGFITSLDQISNHEQLCPCNNKCRKKKKIASSDGISREHMTEVDEGHQVIQLEAVPEVFERRREEVIGIIKRLEDTSHALQRQVASLTEEMQKKDTLIEQYTAEITQLERHYMARL